MEESIRLMRELAAKRGITDSYRDVAGNLHETTDDTRMGLLEASGYRTDRNEALRDAIASIDRAPWMSLLEPAVVRTRTELAQGIRIQLPATPDEIDITVKTEEGDERRATILPVNLSLVDQKVIESRTYRRFALPFPWDLELGYYSLRLSVKAGAESFEQTTRLVVCPERAYLPEWYERGERLSGIGISLYGLHSAMSIGAGDLGDLRGFIEWASESLAVEFIGLNPLHAIFNRQPYNASPYLSSSRFFRNFIYIDLQAVPDFRESEETQALFHSPDVQTWIEKVRRSDTVPYEEVAALKLLLLEPAFHRFLKEGADRNEFDGYVEREGSFLDNFATFCAIDEEVRRNNSKIWSWTEWPEALRDAGGAGVARFKEQHATRILFFKYLQWQLDRQLAAADAFARERGMRVGLYLDLALAVDRHGADFWAYRHLFVENAKTGAPPDSLAPQGQDWQFPPPDPEKYRADGYRLFSEKIRRNCRYAGALRLDHVMRLMRLFWIPPGRTAAQGAYVHDHQEDLLKIVCLESVRNQTMIIGEDLGTVPDWVREELAKRGILSYRVFHFERDRTGGFNHPEQYPRLALATLSTHDLSTLCGFWEETDIQRRKQAGLLATVEDLQRATENRRKEKELIAKTLNLPAQATPEQVRDAVAEFLASTPSALMILSQEDIFLEREQQNMPGTTVEHLNWARKMLYPIEDFRKNLNVARASGSLKRILQKAGRIRKRQ